MQENDAENSKITTPYLLLFLALMRETGKIEVYKVRCTVMSYDDKPCYGIFLKDYNQKFANLVQKNVTSVVPS